MPARRQHRRGDGTTREQRAREQRDLAPVEDTVEREWLDHQAWERARRAPALVAPPRLRPRPFDIRPALAVVLADFARWERER